jgi:CheY-like chemotaxis protein
MRLARDGSEAVKVYEDALHEHDPFHLVFMDISMPVRLGISTCLTLLDSNPEIRSWMVSKPRISFGKRRSQQHIPTDHITA